MPMLPQLGAGSTKRVSSAVCQHAENSMQRGMSYAADSYYLISPLNTWDGDLRIGERHVYRGVIRPGMLRLAAPTEHEHKVYPDSARALVVRLPEPWLCRMLRSLQTEFRPDVLVRDPVLYVDPTVRRLARLLSEKCSLAQSSNHLVTQGLAEALLGLLVEHQRAKEKGPSGRDLSDEQMRLSCLFVDANLQRPPSIREWSDRLDMSPKDFSRRFFRTNGITPYAWLMERRIRNAQELLRSKISVSELALQLGFANQSHFTETFRKRTGMAPVRWRKLIRRSISAA